MSASHLFTTKLEGQEVTINKESKVVILELKEVFRRAGIIFNWKDEYGWQAFGVNRSILRLVDLTKSKLLINFHSNESLKEYWINYDTLRQFVENNKCEFKVSKKEYIIILRCVKGKTPMDKLSREDLPTKQEVQKLLDMCADSPRDKALFAVHNEAGTRIGEVLTLKIKHVQMDQYGANLLVDGKTGARKIRIVLSVPYITKWINVHPMKDDPEAPLWIYISKNNSFGQPMTYAGFNNILRKRVRQAGLTKRIHSHIFRHKEITEMATKLTEAESRMRHGWGRSSPMPARYTHLNQEDLDNKILQIKGVKKEEMLEELGLRECAYCKIKHAIDAKFCEICSRPLDVIESMRMEKEQEERTKALILETLRQEHSSNSKKLTNKKLEEENKAKQKEIEELKKLLTKVSND